MNVGLYSTRIQASVMRMRDEIEAAYERYPEPPMFWAFIDLGGSSNFRIAHGPMDGYIRAETFFTLIYSVVGHCPGIQKIKEIGDCVFLCCSDFRPIFESLILIDQTATQLAAVAGTQRFPFSVRAAIGFGHAKRLSRLHEDYVGTAIDQLARVMGVRSQRTNLLIHDDAYRPSVEIIAEYQDFVTVGEPLQISDKEAKGMLRPVYYREVVLDRTNLVEFTKHFQPWRISNT